MALAACFLTHPPRLGAQASADDHAAVFLAAVREYAKYSDASVTQVVVRLQAVAKLNETHPGRTPLEQRDRVVSEARLRSLAAQHGFHVSTADRELWRPGTVPPDYESPSDIVVKVIHSVQEVHGDSAVVNMLASTWRVEERREWMASRRFVFARQGEEWVLVEHTMNGGEVVEW